MMHHSWAGVFPPVFAGRTLAETWTALALLLGIVLGSVYFRSRSERLLSRPKVFVFMQIALGISSVLAMQLLISLGNFPEVFQSGGGTAAASAVPGALLSFGIFFVPAFLFSGLLAYGLGSRSFSIFLFLGCALGALGKVFFIVPAGGLWAACLTGSAVIIASGLIGLLAPGPRATPDHGPARGGDPDTGKTGLNESGVRVTGFGGPAAIGYAGYFLLTLLFAVISSRLIFISAGRTLQAESIVAAVFFAGLALGQLLSTGALRHRLGTMAWWGSAAALAGLFGLLAGRQAPSLPLTFLRLVGDGTPAWPGILGSYWMLALMWLASPAILLGSTLLPVQGLPRRVAASGERPIRGGKGWDLTAAASGTLLAVLLACFVPSRRLSIETLLNFVPWISIALGLLMLSLSRARRSLKVVVAACIVPAALILTLTSPAWNPGITTAGLYVRPARFSGTVGLRAVLSETDVIASEESPLAMVSVERTPDAITLKADGIFRAGTAGNGMAERLSAHIPMLLHDRPRSLLVIGAGTGAKLAAAGAYPVETIECVEGTHITERTLRPFASHNRDALRDKRLTMKYAEPWNYISVSNTQYDVVLLESPRPFTGYGAKLLTADFFELLRSRLGPGGMACQAINTADFSPELLGMVTEAFATFFPHVSAWWTGGFDILLVGAMEPHTFDPDAVAARMALPAVSEDLARINISGPFNILALYVAGREEILSAGNGSHSNTLLKNRLAHQWPVQTLRPVRGEAFEMLNRANADPFGLVESGAADPMRFESAREDLARCAEARSLYVKSANEVAAGSVMRGISLLDEAMNSCRHTGMLKFPMSEYYMLMSRRNMAAGRLGEAVENARRAVELDPLGPSTFYNLASIQLESDPATATALLARATELDPSYIPAYLLKAKAELSEGKPRDATETIGRVLSVEPFNATAHHLKGLSLIQRKQYEAGRLEIQKALEGMPGDLDLMEALAYTWVMQGRMERAGDLYREVLEVEPDRFGALNNYATVLAEQGKLEEAVAAWTRALALSPGNRDIMANIEEARQNMRR
jgi:spermidine synthase/tetratricopeptide (TPR) repeat protein